MRGVRVASLLFVITVPLARPIDTLHAQEASQPAPPALSTAEKILGLSLIWREATYNFAFFDRVPSLEWDSLYQATIPRVSATTSTWAYYRELQRFTARLHDGHTGVSLPRAWVRAHDASPWVQLQLVDGRVVVRSTGRSLASRVPLYSEVVAIDGRPPLDVAMERRAPFISQSTEHALRDAAIREALSGPPNQPVHVRLVTPSGESRTISLLRDRWTRADSWTPDADAAAPSFAFRWLPDKIAYVAINTMTDTMAARMFEDSLPALRTARGLIIDVRENDGGNSSIGWRIASWLTDDTLDTSHWRTREHNAAYKAWGLGGSARFERYGDMKAWYEGGSHGRLPPAKGERVVVPTVVLQDHQSFSAAEDFLVVVDALPQVTLVGRPSAGSTGNPLEFRLPGGGWARIVTKRDTYPDGRDFVGVGVQPDIVVARTLDDLRQGRDSQLARALQVLTAGRR